MLCFQNQNNQQKRAPVVQQCSLPEKKMSFPRREVIKLPHHEQQELCTTRSSYRQGRILTAVKVYTVNDESSHLIVTGVPALGLQDEVRRMCSRFGDVKSLVFVPKYSEEEFTDTYHVHFTRIQSARFAKRQMDGKSFFGGTLHVCYAPEMETVPETRAKLVLRRREVRTRCLPNETNLSSKEHDHSRVQGAEATPMPCIWQGMLRSVDPRTLMPAEELEKASSAMYGPHLPDNAWLEAGLRGTTFVPRPQKHLVQVASQERATRKRLRPTILESKLNVNASEPSGSKGSVPKPPPVLRFVPSQVKGVPKRIVFRKNHGITSTQPPNTSDNSLDATIQSVREQIRAVSVPNVKIVFEKKGEIGGREGITDSKLPSQIC